MAKKQIVSNKTAESAPVSPLIVDNVDALKARMAEVRAAQQEFATFTQEQVDKIFQAAAIAANQMRIPLAKMAVEETGMGVVEDKVRYNEGCRAYRCCCRSYSYNKPHINSYIQDTYLS